jgi:hypothetical protein
MPRGAKPKVYPPDLVEQVRQLYATGLTQAEVAAEVGSTQRVIFNVMRRHGIRARPAAKRDQRGMKNAMWKGSDASYAALHKRVEQLRGRPAICKRCGTSGPGRNYDWANLTGRYDDPADYERMCRSCHKRYDLHRDRWPSDTTE